MSPPPADATSDAALLRAAFALALGAAVSLGLARFSYALLLPPMRADLGWSYFTAGAMNTANAAGYLAGALLAPRVLARWSARTAFVGGGLGAAVLLALHGLVHDDAALFVLRFLTGVASAATFVSGGLLAARLGSAAGTGTGAGRRLGAGLVLGLYYGGTGLGIVACALLLPPLIERPDAAGGTPTWPQGWWALGAIALVACAGMARVRAVAAPAASASDRAAFAWRDFAFALAGYFMFGLGYIGYMTFIVSMLREQGLSRGAVSGFYSLLGIGVVASSWLWAALLQRARAGGALALLNGLLAGATLLPVLVAHPIAAFVSGGLFGAVFLSVVASTTALVRRNLPAVAWSAGISAFTIVFAAGQIVGPSLVGWLSDSIGGLRGGLALSAALLAIGALLPLGQRARG